MTEIWTQEQVDKLNAHQANHSFSLSNLYTCPGDKGDVCLFNRALTATREGWVCHCGKYRQTWTHGVTPRGSIND